MAVTRLVANPFPLALCHVWRPRLALPLCMWGRGRRSWCSRLPLPQQPGTPFPCTAAEDKAVVVADGDRGDAEAEAEAEVTRVAVVARKQSERQTYLVAAVMSSLEIMSMAVGAVYYRFA